VLQGTANRCFPSPKAWDVRFIGENASNIEVEYTGVR
jgi:hypothetical protein